MAKKAEKWTKLTISQFAICISSLHFNKRNNFCISIFFHEISELMLNSISTFYLILLLGFLIFV